MRRGLVPCAVVALCACANPGAPGGDATLARAEAALRSGDLADALALVDRGLSVVDAARSTSAFWHLRLMRADIAITRRALDEAAPTLHAPIPTDVEYDTLRARQRILLARVQAIEGQQRQALQTLDAARPLAASDPEASLDIDLLAGQIQFQASRWGDGEALLTSALARASHAGDRFRQLVALNNLGMGGLVRGHYDRALEWFQRALAFADLEATTVYATALTNAGICYARLGLVDQAIELQKRSVAIHERRGAGLPLVKALGGLGNSFVLSGRPRDGIPHLQRALEVAQRDQIRDEAAIWAGNLSATFTMLGSWDDAERFNEAARHLASSQPSRSVHHVLNAAEIAAGRGRLDQAEALFTEALGDEEAGATVRWAAQAGLARVAAAAHRPDRAAGLFEAALTTIERTRSDLRKTDYKLSFLTQLISFYRDYVDVLVSQGQDERALEIAESSRGRVLAERQQVEAPVRASGVSFRQLTRRAPTVLLSYWLAPTRSHLWVIADGRTRRVELPPAATIEAAVREYRQAIDSSLADPLTASGTPGDRLYEMLVRPAGIPHGASVVVVPDGALHGVNFETLPVDGPRRHYFIEDAEIQVSPSLALLGAASRRRTTPARAGRSLLLIGNPTPRAPEFPALSYAATEMTSITRHFPPGGVTAYDGARASPTAYRDERLERFSMIHFTAHATASVESPLDSAVVLSGPDSGYKLYARDIAELPLDADLVTVSACRSAGERAYAGEGLVGFAWAFLRAGARRVIGGLWDVDDRATARLMDGLYERLSANDPPAKALRAAKLALIHEGGRTSRPYYWGPMQMYAAQLN